MVLRTSEPMAPQTGGQLPQVRQSGIGAVAPNVAKHSKGGRIQGESTADRILQSFMPIGMKLAEKAFHADLEEQYLSGVAQASTVQSEEELETNPMTSDWVKAGYRDTAGRLAVAQQQAQLQLDLPTLAKGTPEQFKQYMTEKRKPLLDQLNGMSKQQRAALFGQQALDEAAATKKYTSARAAWILKQEQESIQASMTVRRANLDAAKGNAELYQTEVQGFVGAIYKDIWQNPKLTDALRIDMTRQAAEYASSSDNVAVYAALKDTAVDFPDGKKGTMMSRLPFEDQIKVDKAHRSAMDRVKVTRAADFETWVASSFAAWQDPNIGATETYEEVDAQIRVAEAAGILSPGKRESILKTFFKAKATNIDNGTLAKAYASGDQQQMLKMGKGQDDGLKAWLKTNKNAELPQVVSGLMAIGNNSGMDSAFDKAGEFLKPAFAQLGYAEDINPQNAQLVTQSIAALQQAELNNPGARSKFLQSMSSDQQDLALYMGELQREGVTDPLTVVRMARAKQLQDKQTGGLRQEMVANARKEDAAVVQEIGDLQILGTLSATAKSWFSADADAKKRMSTGRNWFENADRTAEIRAQGQIALAEELSIIAQASPTLSAESRKSKALASLGARTVDTSSGPLTMPRGQSLQSYFGVPAYADQKMVGQAIDDMMQPGENNRLAWGTDAANQLTFRELNADGAVVRSGIVDPKSVAPFLQTRLDKEAATQSNLVGPGVTVQGVSFNGLNTADVEPDAMLNLRRDIIKSEGVRNTPYADSGGTSFGVGIHQTNNHYQRPPPGGTYTSEQIANTFMRASNDAAEMAKRSMASIGVQGEQYLRLFGELAYQSPKSARDPDLLAYISIGDKDGAMAALKATAAYKGSHPERRAQYVNKLESAMR